MLVVVGGGVPDIGDDVGQLSGNTNHPAIPPTHHDLHIFTWWFLAWFTLPRAPSSFYTEMETHKTKSRFGNLNIFYDGTQKSSWLFLIETKTPVKTTTRKL